ncbi:MSHA biogenesis protein MshI [Pseudomonas sp. PDM14]|uniref:PilN domain-containing protein n=1 Tax=Pseudomonas sp. PDM14 TaxID=2769288 RepID=UPI001781724A|nr:PilN domain-containing protein [Pseudomonas sp. PDM14]MBD9483634.1 MSHA biogenesis protein MshI [Pseudomonas sp. PDM14]
MQNLNLYQVESAQRSGPQPQQMLIGLVALLFLCLLHGFWQGFQVYRGTSTAAVAEAQAQQAEQQLIEAKAQFIEPQLNPDLPLRLADQEARNRELQRLISYLEILARQQRVGFVAPLAALAEQHPPSGLWLNTIVLTEGGTDLRLKGTSQTQELLPEYLQRLSQNAVFQGRQFARFDVQRGDDALLHFDLSSRTDDKEETP